MFFFFLRKEFYIPKILFSQIDDDFMAHYQLSYGFNSNNANSSTNETNSAANPLLTKSTEIQNIKNQSQSSLNISSENSGTEKRKLPQPSEPSKIKYIFFCFDENNVNYIIYLICM